MFAAAAAPPLPQKGESISHAYWLFPINQFLAKKSYRLNPGFLFMATSLSLSCLPPLLQWRLWERGEGGERKRRRSKVWKLTPRISQPMVEGGGEAAAAGEERESGGTERKGKGRVPMENQSSQFSKQKVSEYLRRNMLRERSSRDGRHPYSTMYQEF